jgi:flagellar basal-body rod modification protein FlgD
MSAITALASTANSSSSSDSSSSLSSSVSQTLDQNDFLQLLVAQMTNQDPTNPMSDTEYISVMAQFTSIEQTKAIESDVSSLSSSLRASALLGKTVTLTADDSSTTTGVVTSVDLSSTTPKIVVDGVSYDVSQVTSVSTTDNTTSSTTSS